MKKSELKLLVGQKIEWEYAHDHQRGTYMVDSGIVEKVQGKNLWMDNGDVKWADDIHNITTIPKDKE